MICLKHCLAGTSGFSHKDTQSAKTTTFHPHFVSRSHSRTRKREGLCKYVSTTGAVQAANLHSCPGSRQASSAWRPDDQWPAHCPGAPAPWWLAPGAEPNPGRTREEKDGLRNRTKVLNTRDRKGCYLPPRVSVIVLVQISHGILLRVFFLNHLVGHFLTHTLKNRITEDSPSPVCSVTRHAYVLHRSRSGSSTARREPPAPLLSGWCVSTGWSKPSGLLVYVPQQNPSELLQTDRENTSESKSAYISLESDCDQVLFPWGTLTSNIFKTESIPEMSD